ncbi:MAG: Spo0E family sporulation regulatory protein-aspartic acid phosphatase [Xylanivirga thermophila]|jgi:hypothetical protein|uniref:Spo0E family sporulation regulatory protein-aspartic acid phosphatase n=1 Tax=Xylanivirga thermophila TaxID=2496273 RepID=UPI00101B90BE|nr:Spo0E family sporulation regulatory protein-aspartic acid phosphatase [Xylanivirga thermophila]
MKEMQKIQDNIENIRKYLNDAVDQQLDDRYILWVSQLLDELIVDYYELQLKNNNDVLQ